jgi:hypothetical protein
MAEDVMNVKEKVLSMFPCSLWQILNWNVKFAKEPVSKVKF